MFSKKFKKNNKGFSLVELIIVIAIMAALVAILAPQYLKYVEKSRITADENLASEITSALKVAATDEDVTGYGPGTVVLSKGAAPTVAAAFTDALTEYYGDYTKAELKSAKYDGGITIEVSYTNGTDASGGYTVVWGDTPAAP